MLVKVVPGTPLVFKTGADSHVYYGIRFNKALREENAPWLMALGFDSMPGYGLNVPNKVNKI